MCCKVYLLFDHTTAPSGGGNNFLRSLARVFGERGVLAASPEEADVVLANSHHYVKDLVRLKGQCPHLAVVHRIDGPIRDYTQRYDARHDISLAVNRYLADATIFQSAWSLERNIHYGLSQQKPHVVIHNAPDNNVFFPDPQRSARGPVKLVATSWSTNMNKGFDTLQWLDENLDFSRYQMTFVGNTPVSFRNITHIPPQSAPELAALLREHDIFVFPSKFECCSNALLEGMHCGLPVVAYAGTSNPELVAGAGELFEREEEIPALLEKITADHAEYVQGMALPDIEQVADSYLAFMKEIVRIPVQKRNPHFSRVKQLAFGATILKSKIIQKVANVAGKLG